MKLRIALTLITVVLSSFVCVVAQETRDAGQKVYDLRVELIDVQSKEAQAKLRLEQLDSDLKPENIERYFTGYGSTRPEELRESRRRQLLEERALVVNLLEQLSTRRVGLESAVAQAEAQAYLNSALGTDAVTTDPTRLLTATRVLIVAIVGLLILGTLTLFIINKRRRSTAQAK